MILYYGDYVTINNSMSVNKDGYEIIIWPGEQLKVIEGTDNDDTEVYVEYNSGEENIDPIYLHIDLTNIKNYE